MSPISQKEESQMYRKLVKILVENFTKEELETIYTQSSESMAVVAQAIMFNKFMGKK